jgi:glycosyltransferase involved in cell wall biosynthesis
MTIGIDGHNLEGQRTGVGRYLVSLLNQWDKLDLPRDLEFILYFKKEVPNDLELTDKFRKKLLKAPFGIQSNALFMHWLLPRAAQEDKADVLFCPGYLAPIFYSGKIALTLHDIIYQARPDLYNWPSFWDKILLKKFSQISAKKAQVIFTPSEFSRREVIKHYQVAPTKVLATPLAVDGSFKRINDEDSLSQVKKKYQVKDRFVFYIGSIFNRRHLPEIIRAFEKIAKKMPNYQFLIIGANHTSPFINVNGLVGKVNQVLERPAVLRYDYLSGKDLVSLYNAADLLVWLSDYEGFGLPVLEAMACGTPVVTSPLSSIPEVAGDAAIYVRDSSDVEEIYRAIYQGLIDEVLRKDLIRRGLAQAKKFSWERCAQQTLKALVQCRTG